MTLSIALRHMLSVMSSDDPTPPPAAPAPREAPVPPKPTSRLAIASIIVAIVPCCPVTSLAGAFLAAMALSRIRRSHGHPNGPLGGERLALAALLIGVFGAMIQASILQRWQAGNIEEAESALNERVVSFFRAETAEIDRDSNEPATIWARGEEPAASAIASFLDAASERYGDLRSIDFMSSSRTEGASARHITYAAVFQFDADRVTGAVWTVLPINTDVMKVLDPPRFDLRGILLRDGGQGNLTLGAVAEAAESTEAAADAEEATASPDPDTMP